MTMYFRNCMVPRGAQMHVRRKYAIRRVGLREERMAGGGYVLGREVEVLLYTINDAAAAYGTRKKFGGINRL